MLKTEVTMFYRASNVVKHAGAQGGRDRLPPEHRALLTRR
jgi:hypothetical protein